MPRPVSIHKLSRDTQTAIYIPGKHHVPGTAYLQQLDVSKFNPKEPPPKTEAFWAIANANRPREENELAEVLIAMGQPSATTLALI
jgi:hypothetical protein